MPESRFWLHFFLFSCPDGVYTCTVLIYSEGTSEALCRIDGTNKMTAGEVLSRSFKIMFFSFYNQKTLSWNSELKEINLRNTPPRKK